MHDYVNVTEKLQNSSFYRLVRRTPLRYAPHLSARLGQNIFMKCEDMQQNFSFKIRGAAAKILSLTESERQRGVICVSAGNHGQGVALMASYLKIPATVVMPKNTPMIKVKAVAALGAKVVQAGGGYDEASQFSLQINRQMEQTFIHPFDDQDVIAGQGTIGLEIWEDLPIIDTVFVPVGGGGLIAGIVGYLKHKAPWVRIVAVEAMGCASMFHSLKQGRRICLGEVDGFADGVAVKQVGAWPFAICKNYLNDFIQVSNSQICHAIADIYDETRTILEPAGALAMAGLNKYLEHNKPRPNSCMVIINSGANMNFDRLTIVANQLETARASNL